MQADGQERGMTLVQCEGDVFARHGSQYGQCRACGATYDVADRRTWLDGEVRAHAFRAAHIAQAYGLSADTIRSWAARGQLVAHGTEIDVKTGRPVPLYNVGDVLDLARDAAARKAERQAQRARRRENAA
jgi:hypothetical protein